MRTQDPFDLLREQLVTAATPEAVRRRRAQRPLVVLAAALALGGTATAAAVMGLDGEPSPPLKGRLPGTSAGDPARAYAIVLRPNLAVGVAGWCATVRLHSARDTMMAGSGCGLALQASYPQIAGGGMAVSRSKTLTFRIVDRRVAVVRLADGRRIVPRADPALPSGWRAAIAFATAHGRIGPDMLDAELLGADGRPLPLAESPRGVPALPSVKVDPRDPPARPCAIEHRALAHLSARDQRVVKGSLTAGAPIDAAGRPFRTCAAALFYLDGVRLRAAVLVDARDPARAAAPPLPRGYDAASRRVARGRAWLVVDGGTPSARGRLLEALSAHPPSR